MGDFLVVENALVRHRVWRGFGRVSRNRLNGEADVFWFGPNGKHGMRSCLIDDLIPPRRTDVAPKGVGVKS